MPETSRNYTFTVNSPVENDDTILQSADVQYIIWQYEQGTNLHIQGYVQFKRPCTIKTAKKKLISRGHYEIARGTPEQNIAYCTKSETRVRHGGERGTVNKQGKRNDIESFIKSIRDARCDAELLDEHPQEFLRYYRAVDRIRNSTITPRNWEMQVFVYWGRSGSGKTRRSYQEAGDNVYFISKGDQHHSVWFDGYNGQESVILDDFYGWLPWSFMLRLLDRYPFAVQLKGGYREFTSKKIFITSNTHPETWYKNVPNDDLTPLLRRINKIEEMN